MRPDDYETFYPFFKYVVGKYNKVDLDTMPPPAPASERWNLKDSLDFTKHGLLEPLSMRVRVGRNLNKFPLPGSMTRADRIAMEEALAKAFDILVCLV